MLSPLRSPCGTRGGVTRSGVLCLTLRWGNICPVKVNRAAVCVKASPTLQSLLCVFGGHLTTTTTTTIQLCGASHLHPGVDLTHLQKVCSCMGRGTH